jgi:hypothetical protein
MTLTLAGMIAESQTMPPETSGRWQQTNSSLQERPDLISGIIQYTRWPSRNDAIRLCVDQNDTDAASIAQYFNERPEDRPRVTAHVQRVHGLGVDELLDCQAIYFGKVSPKTLPAQLIQLSSKPILTIGQGEDFCTDAGLFCLIDTKVGVRIGANLDAISRTGLHVNPRLLKLTVQQDKGRS